MATESDHRGAEVHTSMLQLDNLMQLDLLLPSQYFRAQRKQEPEQRLMIAVLWDAIHCVEKYRDAGNSVGRRLFLEAQRWFFAGETDWPYSFESICAVLDLDSNAVRERMNFAPETESNARAA